MDVSPSSVSLFNNSTLVPIRSYLTARTYSRLGALPSFDLRLASLPLVLAFASLWPFPYSESIVLTHLFSFRCFNVVSVSSTYRRGGRMAISTRATSSRKRMPFLIGPVGQSVCRSCHAQKGDIAQQIDVRSLFEHNLLEANMYMSWCA